MNNLGPFVAAPKGSGAYMRLLRNTVRYCATQKNAPAPLQNNVNRQGAIEARFLGLRRLRYSGAACAGTRAAGVPPDITLLFNPIYVNVSPS